MASKRPLAEVAQVRKSTKQGNGKVKKESSEI